MENLINLMDENSSIGTSYQTEITTSYKRLVKLLGKPNSRGDRYKMDAEWVISINNKVLTIYNWKDGKNFLGSKGLPLSKISCWHIGAHNKDIAPEVNILISELGKVII